jgi:hypothetical protein
MKKLEERDSLGGLQRCTSCHLAKIKFKVGELHTVQQADAEYGTPAFQFVQWCH